MQKFFQSGVYNEKSAGKIEKIFDKLPVFNESNPQVFFEISIGN